MAIVQGPNSKHPLGVKHEFVSLVHQDRKVAVSGDPDELAKKHAEQTKAESQKYIEKWTKDRGKYGF